MTTKLSVYWAPAHKAERQDLEYIRRLQPYDILILQPDVQDVIDANKASPESEIVLRKWEFDDNHRKAHAHMIADPEGYARWCINQYLQLIENYEAEMRRRGARVLDRRQMPVHFANEPDTNRNLDAINRANVAACQEADKHAMVVECLNLGTGHPALQVDIGKPGSPPDWRWAEGALEAIERGKHYATSHEYNNQQGYKTEPIYPWHCGRHKTWAPRGPRWKIGEHGFENLVNHQSPGHQGWRGELSEEEYLERLDWYLGDVRDDVVSVRIYLTDFRDSIWRTFDTEELHNRLVAIGARHPSTEPDTGPPPEPPEPATETSSTIIDPLVAQAILDVETGRKPFDPEGRLTIRFEAHIFEREIGGIAKNYFRYGDPPWTEQEFMGEDGLWWKIHTGNQEREYEALWAALRLGLGKEAAYRSVSMGIAQIMGFNYKMIGYPSAQAMYEAFSEPASGYAAQVVAFFNYLLAVGLMDAMRDRDWETIALKYNGPGQVDLYAGRLREAYKRLEEAA